jgi:peptide/nickel transport system permease protein
MAQRAVLSTALPVSRPAQRRGPGYLWRRFRRNRLALAALVYLLGIHLVAATAPTLAPHPPDAIDLLNQLAPRTRDHPLGTDENGRDLWARLVYGARPTLSAAVTLIGLSLLVGSLAGLIIGAAGRRTDEVLMRVTELFLAFPQIIWALALTSVLGRGLLNCVLALAITWWAQYARLMRGQVLAVRQREFVLASRALGQREWRILLRHLLPNCFSPVLVKATIDVSLAILLLAALSFLGVGAQPPLPEWGAMVTIGRKYLLDYPWYATFPGLAIFVVVLALNVLGERLRDVLDPTATLHARS